MLVEPCKIWTKVKTKVELDYITFKIETEIIQSILKHPTRITLHSQNLIQDCKETGEEI